MLICFNCPPAQHPHTLSLCLSYSHYYVSCYFLGVLDWYEWLRDDHILNFGWKIYSFGIFGTFCKMERFGTCEQLATLLWRYAERYVWLPYCTAVLEPGMFPKEMAFCVTGLCVYLGDCHIMLQNFFHNLLYGINDSPHKLETSMLGKEWHLKGVCILLLFV